MDDINEKILELFPCKEPYRFIDQIVSVDENRIVGIYRFTGNEFFFEGHFPGFPAVPGAILTEVAAQIGLLAFGMFLLSGDLKWTEEMVQADTVQIKDSMQNGLLRNLFFLVSSAMDYKKVVQPGDEIVVISEKIFFRLGKLKCKVKIETPEKKLVASGIISGMVNNEQLWQIEL